MKNGRCKKTTRNRANPQKVLCSKYGMRPVKVSTKKIFGKGYKTFMSAQSIQTGELYKNSQGKIEPWDSISFSATKPKELNNGNS